MTIKEMRVPTISHVEICADAVEHIREVGGDEKAVIVDFCAEHRIFNSSVFRDCVVGTVNKRFQRNQIEAGVNPNYFV